MLEKLNIDLAALRAVVAEAANEREIAAWISANADLSGVEATNAKMAAVTVGMMPPPNRAFFNSLYAGASELTDETTIFDAIETDDRRLIAP